MSGPSQADTIRDLIFKLPGGAGSEISRDMEGIERIRDAPAYGGKPPGEMSPQELHSVLWQVLVFKDSGAVAGGCQWARFLTAVQVSKKIENTIGKSSIDQSVPNLTTTLGFLEKIPGLRSLIAKITDSISGEQKRKVVITPTVLPVSKFSFFLRSKLVTSLSSFVPVLSSHLALPEADLINCEHTIDGGF